ncbi:MULTISPECIES: alpha/beta fold hydrolase [Marinobacter]|uniref:alpha/beta fold hydrolase n=1 Tax=Marinobacter TaxID=2742 RepID=UPI001D07BC05|nr:MULTISPECIES: alpha/beta hydrolase [Marinobacter]MCK7565699.1 alpha/beta hydrolase [Marinobacter xestospongiae]UDL03434.1 alpha/beta hydrolase [Marinobacter sp. CA1]
MLDHQSGAFLDLDDARIYYEMAGSPHGHPVILLHGGLGSLEDFHPITGLIPDSFQVVAIDMRGHGRSTLGTKPLTYQQHQADIQSLIRHLNLKEYSLLGFSDGGIVAYRLAAANNVVCALVTIGAQWRLSTQDPSFEILDGVTAAAWTAMFPDAPQKYGALNPQGSFNGLVKSCVNLWTDLGTTGYPQDSISSIDCPTLILRGDGDFLLSLEEAAEAQAMISGSSFGNIPFAGHAAIEEAPEITGEIVRRFLLNPRKVQAEA